MRKKFFAMYALVGALVASPVFTSCIDGEESASVTAVRTAKAEQLKAAAALSAATQAINEANQAHQEKLNAIALEKAQWGLEEAKLNHELTMIDYERSILTAQKDLLTAQAALEKYNDGVLGSLTNDYITAVSSVTELSKSIFNKNANLTALKAGLVEAQDFVAEKTEEYTNEIAAKKVVLEMLQAYDVDKVGIVNQLKEMDQKLNTIYNDMNAWEYENGTLSKTAQDDDIKLATILAAKKLEAAPYYVVVTKDVNGYYILNEEDVLTYKQSNAYTNNVETLAGYKAKLGKDTDKEDTKYKTTTIDQTTGQEVEVELPTLYATLAAANKQLDADKKALAEAEKALAENTDATKTDGLETAVTEAKEAINGDGTNEGSEMAVAKAKDAINEMLVTIETYEGNDVFDGYIAAFAGEDYEAYKAAQDAWDALDKEEKDVNAEKTAILGTFFVPGGSDYEYDDRYNTHYYYSFKESYNIDEEIATLEGEIATLEENLESLAATLNLPNLNGKYTGDRKYTEAEIEALIAFVETEIATLNEQLKLKQAIADKAKAALDAYIAENGGESEGEDA